MLEIIFWFVVGVIVIACVGGLLEWLGYFQ
jgi:hypothetical protein